MLVAYIQFERGKGWNRKICTMAGLNGSRMNSIFGVTLFHVPR